MPNSLAISNPTCLRFEIAAIQITAISLAIVTARVSHKTGKKKAYTALLQ